MGDKFDEILAKSQRLTTQLGIDDEATIFSQPLRRGIHELESSRNIGFGTKRYFEEEDKLSAVRLLAQKNFDAVKLSSEVHDIAVETPYDPSERLEGVDLDGYLAHHHDMIVLNAIDDTNRITEDYVKHTQRKRLVDEWQVSRRMYIESLGNVTQHWSKKPSATTSTATGSGTGTVRLPTAQSQLVASSAIAACLGKQTTSTDSFQQLSEIMQKQSTIVHHLHTDLKLLNNPSTTTFSAPTPIRIAPLTQLAESITIPTNTTNSSLIDANGLTLTDLIGYKSILEMMAMMVGENIFDVVPAGIFSPLCFGSGSVINTASGNTLLGSSKSLTHLLLPTIHEKKQFLSSGVKTYLERQQLKSVTSDIDDNIQKGFIEQYGFSTGVVAGMDMSGGSGTGREGITRKQRLKSFIYHLYRTGCLYIDELDPRYIAMMTATTSGSGMSGGSVINIDGSSNNSTNPYRSHIISNNLSRHTSMTDGSNMNTNKMIPVWPFIYYCLTCGDIAVAINELKSCVEKGVRYVESDIVIVLQYFQFFMYKFTSLTQKSHSGTSASTSVTTNFVSKTIASLMVGTSSGGSSNDNTSGNNILTPAQTQEFYNALANCKELYEREINEYNLLLTSSTGTSGGSGGSGDRPGGVSVVDPYRLFILNLVSLSDKTALSDPGIATQSYTLQNYLWANIWFIVLERYTAVALYGLSALSSGSGGGVSDKVIDIGENWLYNAVLDYGGETHFDPIRTNPMKYVTVLLVCHRFGDAIQHLWHTTKTLPAVHLAVTCLHYGLILPHLPFSQNPTFRHVSTIQSMDFGMNNNISDELSPSAMLMFFCNPKFQLLFPELAVDYFLCLNSHWLPFIQQAMATTMNSTTSSSSSNNTLNTVKSPSSFYHNHDHHHDDILLTFIDSHILRSRGIISSLFESFLINIAYDKKALARVVGEPQTAIQEKLNFGYLHEFLDREMINLLLIRCAYQFLSIKQEVGMAIDFYCLAGRLTDALDELCIQLSKVLMIPNAVTDILTFFNNSNNSNSSRINSGTGMSSMSDQLSSSSSSSSSSERTYWITQCVQFYDAYVATGSGPLFDNTTSTINNNSSSSTSNNTSSNSSSNTNRSAKDLIPTFLLLLNLSLFINAACVSRSFKEALVLLDEISIIPTHVDQLKACVVLINSGSLASEIFNHIDDLLLIVMNCYTQILLQYHQEFITNVVLLTLQQQNEIQLKMDTIRQQIHLLVIFTKAISMKLIRTDTQRIISMMEMNVNQYFNSLQQQQQQTVLMIRQ